MAVCAMGPLGYGLVGGDLSINSNRYYFGNYSGTTEFFAQEHRPAVRDGATMVISTIASKLVGVSAHQPMVNPSTANAHAGPRVSSLASQGPANEPRRTRLPFLISLAHDKSVVAPQVPSPAPHDTNALRKISSPKNRTQCVSPFSAS